MTDAGFTAPGTPEADEIVKAFVDAGAPTYGSEMDGSPRCMYCDLSAAEVHETTCLWERAVAYIKAKG